MTTSQLEEVHKKYIDNEPAKILIESELEKRENYSNVVKRNLFTGFLKTIRIFWMHKMYVVVGALISGRG